MKCDTNNENEWTYEIKSVRLEANQAIADGDLLAINRWHRNPTFAVRRSLSYYHPGAETLVRQLNAKILA